MTLDDILTALTSAEDTPAAAMTAAVGQADALAPHVYAAVDKLCRGVFLMPRDNRLLLFGLPVLAAARHPGLYEQALRLVRQPTGNTGQVYPNHVDVDLARLVLSVWDGDADRLINMLEHADLEPEPKTALFNAVARLVFDGRIPRERMVELMSRMERDNLIDADDESWWGWELAAVKLGLSELEEALPRVWTKAVYANHTEADRAESLARLRKAAAAPADPSPFDEEDLRPIDDPVEAVAWVDRRARMIEQIVAEQAKELALALDEDADGWGAEDNDPAREIRLDLTEMMWLDGFLASRQVPSATMSIEMLDGFVTALTIGPKPVALDTWWPLIWGTEAGEQPEWDGEEQERHVRSLITRHAEGIKARSAAGAEHRPEVDDMGLETAGTEWALGFIEGVELTGKAWDPIFKERRADQVILPILALSGEAPEEVYQELDADKRAEIVLSLPSALQTIDAYWRDPRGRLPGPEPVRTLKIGRNDPCPCGSGKKFKKCCGSGTNSTLH